MIEKIKLKKNIVILITITFSIIIQLLILFFFDSPNDITWPDGKLYFRAALEISKDNFNILQPSSFEHVAPVFPYWMALLVQLFNQNIFLIKLTHILGFVYSI